MMKKLFIFLAAAGVVFGCQNNVFAVPEDDNEAVLFIVDFSNSMAEKFRGVKKIDMVLETIDEILPTIPRSQKIGLRVYGHKSGFLASTACKASSLLVPITQGSAGISARSARLPWPISRRPGLRGARASPTEYGGKL